MWLADESGTHWTPNAFFHDTTPEQLSQAIDLMPGIGWLKLGSETITGTNPITDENVNRWVSGTFFILSSTPGSYLTGKLIQHTIKNTTQAITWAKNRILQRADDTPAIPTGSDITNNFPPAAGQLEIPDNSKIVGIALNQNSSGPFDSYIVLFEDGSKFIYKPEGRIVTSSYSSIKDSAVHEIAAYNIDSILGFDLVPPTGMWQPPPGRWSSTHPLLDYTDHGSLQLWYNEGQLLDMSEVPLVRAFEDVDRQRMAVLDYIIGNNDRNSGNFLVLDGRPAAIDNGRAFPTDIVEIRSSFVKEFVGEPLDEDVLNQVKNALNSGEVEATLRNLGLSDDAIDGVMRRLEEIKENGMIVGDNVERITAPFDHMLPLDPPPGDGWQLGIGG